MQNALLNTLSNNIADWVKELGFDAFGVSDLNVEAERDAFDRWINNQYHGSMKWLAENRELRFQPQKLVEGSCRVISVRMNYLNDCEDSVATLKKEDSAYVSRYALGRDYHKVVRKKLATLGKRIEAFAREHAPESPALSRAFVDSAPVLERPLAEKAGLGWTGKHTLILNEEGSWFFLGELFTNIPLATTERKQRNQCGDCEACLKICPTDAFTAPYELDARRCISYLTIEHKGVIPIEFREAMGNRIYGCDDCQLICPWNKYAKLTNESDFKPRHNLDSLSLVTLFEWDEQTFLKKTEGSAIRRAGFQSWRRNIAVALGNAPNDLRVTEALESALPTSDAIVAEHIEWALERQRSSRRRKRKIKNQTKL